MVIRRLYSATVHGLVGLQVDAARHHLTFMPHLPPEWDYVNVANIRVGESMLKLQLRQLQDGIQLTIENSGPAVSIEFRPVVPLGAAEVNASLEVAPRKASHLHASVERGAQDEHAVTAFTAEKGNTLCRIRFRGGVQVSVPHPELRMGEPSSKLRVTDVSLKSETLSVTAYLKQGGETLFTARSGWKLTDITGARVVSREGDLYRIMMQIPPNATPSAGSYVKVSAELRFANR